MENTENQLTKEQMMQQEATKILDGDDNLSQRLVEYAKSTTKSFADEFSDLMKKYILQMKDGTEGLMSSVGEDKKDSINSLLAINVMEEIISILLTACSHCAVTSHIKMSSFVFKAAERFEHAAMEQAISSIGERMMDFMMHMRPEPDEKDLS